MASYIGFIGGMCPIYGHHALKLEKGHFLTVSGAEILKSTDRQQMSLTNHMELRFSKANPTEDISVRSTDFGKSTDRQEMSLSNHMEKILSKASSTRDISVRSEDFGFHSQQPSGNVPAI